MIPPNEFGFSWKATVIAASSYNKSLFCLQMLHLFIKIYISYVQEFDLLPTATVSATYIDLYMIKAFLYKFITGLSKLWIKIHTN